MLINRSILCLILGQLRTPIAALPKAVALQSLATVKSAGVCVRVRRVGGREEITVGQFLFSKAFPALGSHHPGHDAITNHPLSGPCWAKVTGALPVPGSMRRQSSEGAEIREFARTLFFLSSTGESSQAVLRGVQPPFFGSLSETLRYLLDCACLLSSDTPSMWLSEMAPGNDISWHMYY